MHVGDSLVFMADLPANSIDCIWTDPPYLLLNDGITCVSGRMVEVNKGEWDRSQGIELDHEFNRTWLAACHRVLKPEGTIWVSGTLHVYLSVGMAIRSAQWWAYGSSKIRTGWRWWRARTAATVSAVEDLLLCRSAATA